VDDNSDIRDVHGNYPDQIGDITEEGILDKPDSLFADPEGLLTGEDDETLFVEGAGLVLIHPFLVELFSENRLWIGNRWLSAKSQLKAVQLLSYLSFGEIEVNEYQLPLHKILAGLDVDTLVPAGILLNDNEKETCEDMLRAVIEHWKALRSTSPQGLREGFLQREGKLKISENSFQVHIQSRTEDILLSRIPWGFGLIKLPWMQRMMHVKWI
jgi:hypothetical protein